MQFVPPSVRQTLLSSSIWIACLSGPVVAEVVLPNVFGDHMVLQTGQKNKVWGHAAAQEAITVSIADQQHATTADENGDWNIFLDPLAVGGPHELTIRGSNEVRFSDVMVGEVWICSGQSNMQWWIKLTDDPDLERIAANSRQIRMINFPQTGSQEAIWTHDRAWQVCSPETVANFSAVGYLFARQLHQSLQVPIGMINNAWGGSSCEGWIDRDLIASDNRYAALMERWSMKEKEYADLTSRSDLSESASQRLRSLKDEMSGNARPGNIYQGVLKSHLGYGMRGVIWYQGESNTKRAYQYRDMFPLMISNWRKAWGQGEFPFYWVQLADYRDEKPEPMESDWAELREAQTMTMSKLSRTGEAVIIDTGEGKDIHPKNKYDVARRLARWALANEYGFDIPFRSPQFKSMEIRGQEVILTFEHIGAGWRPFDVPDPRGFAVAGADRKFVWAQAKLLEDNRVSVTSELVPEPKSVRYAWADNPVCNMYSQNGLPLTPFRTDDWPGVTAEAR
ncbi:MAG: sialate O-acetylesterase [Planctomycetota bacterium]|nr:sialate O-acetylesterase [Planctomycetota bacterium]MDA1179433.1 sialate O-acetylesterase [Planctomycetota bacterium]